MNKIKVGLFFYVFGRVFLKRFSRRKSGRKKKPRIRDIPSCRCSSFSLTLSFSLFLFGVLEFFTLHRWYLHEPPLACRSHLRINSSQCQPLGAFTWLLTPHPFSQVIPVFYTLFFSLRTDEGALHCSKLKPKGRPLTSDKTRILSLGPKTRAK